MLRVVASLAALSRAVASAPLAGEAGGGPPAVAHWDFSGERPFVDTVHGYELRQADASTPVGIAPSAGGGFGRAAAFGFGAHGHRLYAPRESVPALAAISGHSAEVSVIAWVQLLSEHPLHGGAYVGGVWEEDRSWRQYAIFMDHTGSCAANNGLVAHISAEGGPSPGQRYCESRACGATALHPGAWHCLANTYDGRSIKAYVNGTLDTKQSHDPNNPFPGEKLYLPSFLTWTFEKFNDGSDHMSLLEGGVFGFLDECGYTDKEARHFVSGLLAKRQKELGVDEFDLDPSCLRLDFQAFVRMYNDLWHNVEAYL